MSLHASVLKERTSIIAAKNKHNSKQIASKWTSNKHVSRPASNRASNTQTNSGQAKQQARWTAGGASNYVDDDNERNGRGEEGPRG